MTLVLVHGNPETAAVWDPLVEALGREDVVRLSPPGFGAPVPTGFTATVGEYRDWLIAELQAVPDHSPVDLVGHDWGGGHVINAVMARPDLVRSWCSDIIGVFDPDYVWHDLAQAWQTPEQGEAQLERMFGGPLENRVARLVDRGITPEVAEPLAAAQGEEMARCILALYRSSAQPVMAALGRGLPRLAERPGLAIIATEDHMVGSEDMRRRAASRAGAQVTALAGLGHWWMVQDPARGAQALTEYWATLPA